MKTSISKRGDFKAPRDPKSGQFEEASPQNDPVLLQQCVCWVHACSDLEPVFKLLASQVDDLHLSRGATALGLFLSGFKAALLAELSVDGDALKDAKKSRLRAPYYSRGVR